MRRGALDKWARRGHVVRATRRVTGCPGDGARRGVGPALDNPEYAAYGWAPAQGRRYVVAAQVRALNEAVRQHTNMWIEPIDSTEFLRVVRAGRPGRVDELAQRVSQRWTPQQLCQMLHHEDVDVRRTVCVVLGLVGDRRVEGCLTTALRDDDAQVNELAEHALWSLWFRASTAEAAGHFCRGISALDAEEPDAAVGHFDEALKADPQFAEAMNQRAIAHYLRDRYIESMEDSRRALQIVPCHFGALAGLGHCHAQLGNFAEAGRCYRRALQINPRMYVVAAALGRIERCFSPAQEQA